MRPAPIYPNYFEEDDDVKNFTETLSNELSILHCSILEGRVYLLGEQLKDCRINVNIKNKNHESPLLAALRIPNKEIALDLVEKILNAKPDVNLTDYKGDSPLHEVSRTYSSDENCDKLFLKIIRYPGCDVNIQNHVGETPLHLATSLAATKILIQCGADVNIKDSNGNSPLHKHVTNTEICNFLLHCGAFVNSRNLNGLSPLHEAVLRNAENTVMLFINHGANTNAENENRVTPFHLAYRVCASDFIKEQLWRCTKPVYLMMAVNYDSSLIPKILHNWQVFIKNGQEAFEFLYNLIDFLHFCSYRKRIACGKLVARYFLDIMPTMNESNKIQILRKFACCVGRTFLNFLVKTYDYTSDKFNETEIFEIVMMLLSNGEILDYSDIEIIYLELGDCHLLHQLLKFEVMDNMRKLEEIPLFPRALWSVDKNLTEIIRNYNISTIESLDFYNIHNLARYCTMPKKLIENFCNTYDNISRFVKPALNIQNIDKDILEMKNVSPIPSLLEMSRNIVRMALCEKYKINQAHHLYLLLHQLALPPLIISLIMLDIPLYGKILKPKYCPYMKHICIL